MRVLLVEDNAALAGALSQTLQELGYAVDRVTDGQSALVAASVQNFDLILLDIGLPQLDGFAVLKALRSQGAASKTQTPVMLITARDGLDDRLQGLNLGADDYLIKPFEASELEARMRAILRRSAGRGDSTLALADLLLNTQTKEVRQGETVLKLSPRDYSVLEVLARHAEKLVNKERIVGSIASWDRDFSENSLEVYIHRLRKHLLGSQVEIVTHRGFGYLLRKIVLDK